ncbi:basal-body rod modification protein FlgD [Gemmobacter lanyuensis]|uniref:Basal-body rod modification protein FlgD n=1 Tax=Gemmobacter lanyuensis TaxID=1054497 RepID=A0A918MFY3_9RHOB|nr:flagellar hook capping FlgD N-terminal domain-containing protein [Gemmobacter lanyuensis]GGW21497.1 basal-body rod modification protein FlgD [Gemmobacter lanyuensis]
MSTIDSLMSAATRSGSGNTTGATGRNNLGQDAFLTLLTTQLQNQNPLEPMQNAEFVAQMAQFSTVSGISEVNTTLGGIASGLSGLGLSAASGLIGRDVLVETSAVMPDRTGALRGSVRLEEAASSLVITYSDAETGQLLNTQSLGAQAAGTVDFAWENLPADVIGSGHRIAVGVQANRAGGSVDLPPSLYSRVTGAMIDPASGETTLQVADFGALSALEVQSLR